MTLANQSGLVRLFDESAVLSGGFERNPSFAEIVASGSQVVPSLLEILRREEGNPWVLFALLHAIVG